MPAVTIYPEPIVDDENPFYCPSISAVSFLQSVRQNLHIEANTRRQKSAHTPDFPHDVHHVLFPSFNNLLDRSLDDEDLLQLHYAPRNVSRISAYFRHDLSSSSLGSGPAPSVSADHQNAGGHAHRRSPRHTRVAQTSDSFSEFRGPFKRQRSSMSVNEGSFELSAKADKLQFFSTRNDFTPYERRGVAQDYGRLTSEELADRVRTLEGS